MYSTCTPYWVLYHPAARRLALRARNLVLLDVHTRIYIFLFESMMTSTGLDDDSADKDEG